MNATVPIQDSALIRSLPLTAKGPGKFLLSAGGILLLGGAAKLLALLHDAQMLEITDPLFGVPFRFAIAFLAIAEMGIAWLCLFTNRRRLSRMLVIWLAACLAAYRIGLWRMGWHHPYPLLANLMEALSTRALIADGIVMATWAYLLTGSIAAPWFVRKAAQAAKFHKMFCPGCGGKIRFASQDLGRKLPCPLCKIALTLRVPENLKIACSFCHKHIEFPAHATGQKIPCPHCNMTLTLKESA